MAQFQKDFQLTTATLAELKAAWLAAKHAEKTAAAQRLEIEQHMLALLPAKDEGAVTDKETGISVTYGLTRSVDTTALQAAWLSLPPQVQGVFAWKASVQLPALRTLQDTDTQAFAALARFVTTKPAKPTIQVKE